jgi:hypothetical protein
MNSFIHSQFNRLKLRLGLSRPHFDPRTTSSKSTSKTDGVDTIPIASLYTILGHKKIDIRLAIQPQEDGTLPTNEIMALLAVAILSSPKAVLEIGTFMGNTTQQLAINLPDAIIHTVDLPLDFNPINDLHAEIKKDDFHLIAKRDVGRDYRGTIVQTQIRQYYSDTAIWDFSNAKGASFFFIDGSHTYEYCKNDSERCYELCQGNGVFLWHDCDEAHPGVLRTILEWRHLGRNIIRIEGTSIAYWANTKTCT